MKRWFEFLSISILCATAVILIALQIKLFGWILFAMGAASLVFCRRTFAQNILLVYVSLGILGVIEISTDISYSHMAQMGIALFAAIAIPFTVSKYVYKEHIVRFPFHHGRKWYKKEILYIIGLAGAVSYFLIPFYLQNTGAYLNWNVEPGINNLTRLFTGTNVLGIWDELFFVSTALGIFRKFFSFALANLTQSVLFTSFLYELGFTGWGFIMIFLFALLQGYIFKKTDSLLYVITVHLTVDFVLYLALIHTHHPTWLPIFVS